MVALEKEYNVNAKEGILVREVLCNNAPKWLSQPASASANAAKVLRGCGGGCVKHNLAGKCCKRRTVKTAHASRGMLQKSVTDLLAWPTPGSPASLPT